jgi:hypothetical protein
MARLHTGVGQELSALTNPNVFEAAIPWLHKVHEHCMNSSRLGNDVRQPAQTFVFSALADISWNEYQEI